MANFDAFKPEKKQTDPQNLGANPHFPAHVHKWAGRDADGNVLRNHFLPVANADELRAAEKDGWSAKPVHTEPEAEPTVDDLAPKKHKKS